LCHCEVINVRKAIFRKIRVRNISFHLITKVREARERKWEDREKNRRGRTWRRGKLDIGS